MREKRSKKWREEKRADKRRQEESGQKRGYETDEEKEHEMEAGGEQRLRHQSIISSLLIIHPNSERLVFVYHPEQNENNAVIQKVFSCKDGTNRRWLTTSREFVPTLWALIMGCYHTLDISGSNISVYVCVCNQWLVMTAEFIKGTVCFSGHTDV